MVQEVIILVITHPVMSTADRAIDRRPFLYGRSTSLVGTHFANGEGGMLYLPNVLFFWLFPIQTAFLMLTVAGCPTEGTPTEA